MSAKMYTCRECERPINQATELCPYCGADLTMPPELAALEGKKRGPLGAVLRWGVLLAALWGFLWFVLPERSGDAAEQAETRAIEMLQQGHRALAAYGETQGSFPPSLEALPRDASSAMRQAAQRALGLGYELHYTPSAPGPDGRVQTFALRARAGLHGYRNFFVDQTGVLRATKESRPATADDPPI
jgi:hypothetical protein